MDLKTSFKYLLNKKLDYNDPNSYSNLLIFMYFSSSLSGKAKMVGKKNAVDMGTYRGAYFPILFCNNC